MSTQEYIRSITEILPDDFPTLTPLPEGPGSFRASSSPSSNSSTITSFFLNITWQTWVIIVLVLALIGINVFAYLAKGTQETASLFGKIVGPILKIFGYETLETTKQTVQASATGTKAGVDIVANTGIGIINTIEDSGIPTGTTGTAVGLSSDTNTNTNANTNTYNKNTNTYNKNTNTYNKNTNIQGINASSSLPVQNRIQQTGGNIEQWQEGSLEKALENASQSTNQVEPDNSRSSIQTTGKAGWCFIGKDQGFRTCSEIGVNDGCMSGDVFPSQEICMNPSLRA
jgi:hypothetical protein